GPPRCTSSRCKAAKFRPQAFQAEAKDRQLSREFPRRIRTRTRNSDLHRMIDWPAIHREALDIFVRYLQIDTTNPPGNEKPAARYLGSLLETEGIETEYIETAPGREALVARLRGDGSKRAFMLCNHT